MWKLSIEDDQGNKTVVKLVRDEYTIGRAEENAIRLTERNISRRHASLRKVGPGWVIADHSSYNGCFVNGTRVNQQARLEHGDLVQFGDYRLTVLDERLQPESAPGSDLLGGSKASGPAGQPDRFVMLVGPTPGTEYALGAERLVVGRGEECDIAINHSSVSRVHAEVHALGQGRYEVIDLGSSNGVRINGIELQRSLIHARDVVELGDVILKFIPAGEFYKPTAEESQQIGALSAALVGQPAARVVPTSAKIIAGVVGLGLLMVLGVIIFGRASQPIANEPPAAPQIDKTTRSLIEAKVLLDQGDVAGAHAKVLAEVPEGSNARESGDFRAIEAAWADALLQRAATEEDLDKKRNLLEQVARTTSVDSVRRKRANAEIEKLASADADRLDIEELPSVPSVPEPKPAAPAPKTEVAAVTRTPTPVRPAPPPDPKPARSAPAPVSDGLVRDNPFDTPASHDDAKTTDSGANAERRQALATKNALKTKAANGTASDQELRTLRALCRQLGDASCAE